MILPDSGRGTAQSAVEGTGPTQEPSQKARWLPPRQLGGAAEFQPGIETIVATLRERHQAIHAKRPTTGPTEILLSVVREPDKPGNWLATLPDGIPVGRITSRTKLGALLAAGQHVARAKVKSVEGFYQDQPPYKLNAVFYVGPPGCEYVEPVVAPKQFPLRLVGEQFYARAIARCREGDRVTLVHETGNPYDARALAVVSPRNEIIGYIPREGWLHRALLDEGNGYRAIIVGLFTAERGFRKAVIRVDLAGDPAGKRAYTKPDDIPFVTTAKVRAQPPGGLSKREAATIFGLIVSIIVSIIGMLAKHG